MQGEITKELQVASSDFNEVSSALLSFPCGRQENSPIASLDFLELAKLVLRKSA